MAERDYLAAVRDHVVVFDGSMGALLEDKNLSLEHDYRLPGRAHEVLVLNRPAVIELVDARGRKHHVLLKELGPESVVLQIEGEARRFARADVERYWYGKYLTLWQPPPSGDMVLRVGMQGPAVTWLRRALARANGEAPRDADNVSFDRALERAVREFQRRHRLEPDGIVGPNTLVHLDAYSGADLLPPPLVRASLEGTH